MGGVIADGVPDVCDVEGHIRLAFMNNHDQQVCSQLDDSARKASSSSGDDFEPVSRRDRRLPRNPAYRRTANRTWTPSFPSLHDVDIIFAQEDLLSPRNLLQFQIMLFIVPTGQYNLVHFHLVRLLF
ncbi:hypothetical protein J6590_028198 [Homalodisca vitripennis]|nr:hypothetical protein J6590_028198 [Homalodisca vitripennis]